MSVGNTSELANKILDTYKTDLVGDKLKEWRVHMRTIAQKDVFNSEDFSENFYNYYHAYLHHLLDRYIKENNFSGDCVEDAYKNLRSKIEDIESKNLQYTEIIAKYDEVKNIYDDTLIELNKCLGKNPHKKSLGEIIKNNRTAFIIGLIFMIIAVIEIIFITINAILCAIVISKYGKSFNWYEYCAK